MFMLSTAFARNADDIADHAALTAEDKVARLDVMEDVLLGRRAAGSPSALRLRASLAETGVTARHSTDLLIAFRRDATKRRYASWDELYDYCRYSAMPVGRHVLDLHGESLTTHAPSRRALHVAPGAESFAGLRKDRSAGPLLSPARPAFQFGASVEDVRGSAETPGLRRVFAALLDRLDTLNREAIGLPRSTRDRRLRLETAVIVGLARRLASRLRRGDPLARRVKLTKNDAVLAVLVSLRFLA